MLNKLIISCWILVSVFLFAYSFTQVDLGLTLNQASLVQYIQKSFQYIGYFNRPLSTYLYVSIVTIMFLLYSYTLFLVNKKRISLRRVWLIVVSVSVILLFSYSAFSHDIFNYMFDARIVTEYGENPYEKKALDFPQDPMLSFMHWTHRTYPYGPSWLGLTIPLTFVGGNFFLLTFYMFKALAAGSYLLSCLLIEKIAGKNKLTSPEFALTFFALNPLVIIESLVSGHNDIVMVAIVLAGVYFLVVKKKYTAWILLFLSAGVKFATGMLLPLFIWYPNSSRRNKEFIFFMASVILMIAAVCLATVRTTFQPWYLLLPLPFCAFISKKPYILIPSLALSYLTLFQYVPFFYLGNYDPPVTLILNTMLWVSIGVSVVLTVGQLIFKKLKVI